MRGFLFALAVILICVLLLLIFDEDFKKRLRNQREKETLLREKERLINETSQKEKLRDCLEQKFKMRLYPGFVILLLFFLAISFGFSLLFFGNDFESVIKGVAITEGAIFSVTPFILKKPIEFKYILTHFAPFLKKKVYGKHIDIETEIENNYLRIKEIDEKLAKLIQSQFA